MSINKVILVGNVGKDPVVRYFDKGVAKATFPLATSETYTNQQGETITATEWHNIVLWRSLAEVAEKTIKKGAQVYIVGKIKSRSYVDKDGANRYITEILADVMLLLERKQGTGTGPAQAESRYENAGRSAHADEPGEPYPPYQPGSSQASGKTDKPAQSARDADGDGFPGNTPGAVPDDDDLPF